MRIRLFRDMMNLGSSGKIASLDIYRQAFSCVKLGVCVTMFTELRYLKWE